MKTCQLLPNFVVLSLLIIAMPSQAEMFTETNKKIIYLTASGFGPEGREEQFAGIKLDTKEPLQAVCAWDVIAFDPATEAGKKIYKELSAIAAAKSTLKSISFSKDKEGDCYLEKYEK